jgi:hypothetical protein
VFLRGSAAAAVSVVSSVGSDVPAVVYGDPLRVLQILNNLVIMSPDLASLLIDLWLGDSTTNPLLRADEQRGQVHPSWRDLFEGGAVPRHALGAHAVSAAFASPASLSPDG